jgi:hypothetical protein
MVQEGRKEERGRERGREQTLDDATPKCCKYHAHEKSKLQHVANTMCMKNPNSNMLQIPCK